MTATDAAPNLPTIILDKTLTDLYREAGRSLDDKTIGQVLCGFSALTPLGPDTPRNRKYIYQDGPFASGNALSTGCNSTPVKYLSLVTQRDAFICGPSPTIFFHINSSSSLSKEHDQKQVLKTLTTLPNSQRPRVIFCAGPEFVPMEEAGIDLLACKIVTDTLERYRNIIPRETNWFLNFKRALAESGLPTPASVTIAVEAYPMNEDACCPVCQDRKLSDFVIPDGCEGPRGEWLSEQSERVFEAVKSHPVPFVLKNQQTFGGAGTYFVRSEDERQKAIDTLKKGLLSRLLSTVNASNAHLEPALLILSDLVQNPIADYGITFFMNEKGRGHVLLGVCKQTIAGDTAWIRSRIDYRQQQRLHSKFSPLVQQIADWLQSYDYIGPIGADVLETQDGSLHVVDLNVRTTGSICLPLLRKHFTSRGLHCASSFSIFLEKRRSGFVSLFADEFEQGRLCILSWYEDQEDGRNLADVVAAADDDECLKEMMDRVKEISGHITF